MPARVLHRYLLRDFWVGFGLTLLVFTFVMYIGALIKAIDLLSRGVSTTIIMQVFLYNIPYILSFSIPMSAITAVLLLFGRLSIDGEITAMKACGLSLWQIITPVVLSSVVLTSVCLYLNFESAPASHFARRQALVNIGEIDPVALLEEGRFTDDFPGYQIRIDSRQGNEVQNVVIYELMGNDWRRYIRAKRGVITTDPENLRMEVDLFDVQITEKDPKEPEKMTLFPTERYSFNPSYHEIMRNKNITKKPKNLNFMEIMKAIRDITVIYPQTPAAEIPARTMECMIEFHRRVAFAVSCFSFTILGIPLGLKSRRKESSLGILISLLLVVVFYLFIIVADSLTKYPQYFPDLIVWVPVILSQVAGVMMLRRAA